MVKAKSGITEQASIPSVNTLSIEENVHRQKLTQKKFSPTVQLLQNFYLSPHALNPNHTPNSTHTSLLRLPEASCPEKALCLDKVGGAEGQLLHLSEVIGGVLIGHNTTDPDERALRQKPYL